jgi:hypothetical protein
VKLIYRSAPCRSSRATSCSSRDSGSRTATFRWEDVGLFPGGSATLRDLWEKNLGAFTGRFEMKVGPHDVAMLKVTAKC